MAKPPNTISDKDWRVLQDRAAKTGPLPFSRKAVAQRKASDAQRRKAGLS